MQIWPGRPYPLGATYDGAGTNFAVFSEVAERVELCLIDDASARSKRSVVETRIEMTEVDGFVWHTYLPGLQPGQRVREDQLTRDSLLHRRVRRLPQAGSLGQRRQIGRRRVRLKHR